MSIDVLSQENRKFPPPPSFVKQAWIRDETIYEKADEDPEGYWAGWAQELDWFKPWDKVLEWKPPYAKWFVGGKINASFNCLDRHLKGPCRDKTAILWEGEPGDARSLSYLELSNEVNRCANVLKGLDVQKGDRVTIYLPMIPELVISLLACARIGAVHSVVFGGFSAEALRDRINDAQSRLLITANMGWRRGNPVPLKKAADEALKETPSIEKVLVVKRGEFPIELKKNRDFWWHELMQSQGLDPFCEPEWMDSEDMLFTLYTSGTTGKPKGIVHTTGGYLTGVYATTKWVFDLKEEDIYWCTADIGWVTGHSYIVYGPLANGATVVMYEGAPDWPEKDRFWKIVEKYRISILYTAPTAIRAFMKWGTEWPRKADLSSLRLLGSVGEPINPEAWVWYHENIGGSRCPIVDTWWQTETGMIMITPLPGLTTLKPGSATRPFPGVSAEVLNEAGEVVPVGGGYAALMKPWPAMLRGIFNDTERYEKQYWSKWEARGGSANRPYFTGDGAKRDEDGYFWFLGRVDDVLNVAGHRIGTAEVESALVEHPAVAEAAVVGKNHEIKGQALAAFVVLKEASYPTSARIAGEGNEEMMQSLIQELKNHVAKKIGAIARPDDIIFSADLPKTRSGKIMRRLLRDIAEGKALGDTTTLADPAVIAQLKQKYEEAD